MFIVELEGCHDCAHDTMGLFSTLRKATDFVEEYVSSSNKNEGHIPHGMWFISEWPVDTTDIRGKPAPVGLHYRAEVTYDWHENGNDRINVVVNYSAPRGTLVRKVPLASKK